MAGADILVHGLLVLCLCVFVVFPCSRGEAEKSKRGREGFRLARKTDRSSWATAQVQEQQRALRLPMGKSAAGRTGGEKVMEQ